MPEQRQAALPPADLPIQLAANAHALGVELNENQWRLLAEDERYALMKLGGGQRAKRKFAEALKEFLPD